MLLQAQIIENNNIYQNYTHELQNQIVMLPYKVLDDHVGQIYFLFLDSQLNAERQRSGFMFLYEGILPSLMKTQYTAQ